MVTRTIHLLLRAKLASLTALALTHAIPTAATPVATDQAAVIIVSDLPPITADMMDWCGSGIDADDLYQYGLRGGFTLWQHLCPVAGVNILSRWYLVAPGEVSGTPLDLPNEGGATSLVYGIYLPNATYDADRRLLQSVRYDSDHGSCGTMMTWHWTGTAFRLIERAEQHDCGDQRFTDWPITYQLPAGGH